MQRFASSLAARRSRGCSCPSARPWNRPSPADRCTRSRCCRSACRSPWSGSGPSRRRPRSRSRSSPCTRGSRSRRPASAVLEVLARRLRHRRRLEGGVHVRRRRVDVLAEHARAHHVSALRGRRRVGPRVAVQDRAGREQARIAGRRPGQRHALERGGEARRGQPVERREVAVQEGVVRGERAARGCRRC